MEKKTMSEGMAICPACHAENRLVVDSLPSDAEIHCSRCGTRIGVWADTRLDPPPKPSKKDWKE